MINGSDCGILIRTKYQAADLPYSEESVRDAISILKDWDGAFAERRVNGVTGCVVTPLTIGTAPLLLGLVMGTAGKPVIVSDTKTLFRHTAELTNLRSAKKFDLIQDRGDKRVLFERCKVKRFELRVFRDEAIKLKIDLTSANGGQEIGTEPHKRREQNEERFNGNGVNYFVNGVAYRNIYGVTIRTWKDGGLCTEVRLHRILDNSHSFPDIVESLDIEAKLFCNTYEGGGFGMFKLSLANLVLMADETTVNSVGPVIGPLRYYVGGLVHCDVFTNDNSQLV
jgi:hypothetical protein